MHLEHTAFWKLDNVQFSYGDHPVLSGVSFELDVMDKVALIGANGSGKTTLGKIMMGIVPPRSGQILLSGNDVTELEMAKIGSMVGYIFQQPSRQMFTSSVYEEVAFGLRFRGLSPAEVDRRVTDSLSYFGLLDLADRFPFNLSRGERQRLVIAAVMALQPKFAIFDEPTTGLDGHSKIQFLSLLEQVHDQGVGYMLISHDPQLCTQCTTRTLTLEQGRIVE